jgi:hypothetical protein
MAECLGMSPVLLSQFRPGHRLRTLSGAWYAALALAALLSLLIQGDPAAALVLAIILPVALLSPPITGSLLTLAAAAAVSGIALVVSVQPGFDPTLRSQSLTVMLLAPPMGLAAIGPALVASICESQRSAEASPIQSSISCMSDSTAIGTVGKLTLPPNRSRAA